jgi:hypothetical protein
VQHFYVPVFYLPDNGQYVRSKRVIESKKKISIDFFMCCVCVDSITSAHIPAILSSNNLFVILIER